MIVYLVKIKNGDRIIDTYVFSDQVEANQFATVIRNNTDFGTKVDDFEVLDRYDKMCDLILFKHLPISKADVKKYMINKKFIDANEHWLVPNDGRIPNFILNAFPYK